MSEEIFRSFSQSIDRLTEILGAPKTVANRDSSIKRFELTFELSWKSAKKYLGNKGIVCRSPRDCFSEAFRLGLVRDNPHWFKMIEDRNLSVHTYNEKLADAIYGRLKDYLELFTELNNSLAK
ncbi:MAG: nucleotidyltransferase substrate binding protein [Acidobacteriia bacterium]|nr:nucleotidyltransferase substrate binding protein [Terriglobia bacterium]